MVLWYARNNAALDKDPMGQMAWLQGELEAARSRGQAVLVAAHIPNGFVERDPGQYNLKAHMGDAFNAMLREYADVVVAFIAGHEHSDAFRVVYGDDGTPAVPVFLTPALTPWNATNIQPLIDGNNPSARCYEYDDSTGAVVDYAQYYVKLAAVAPDAPELDWELEYRASDVFGGPVTPQTLDAYYRRLLDDDAEFAAYRLRNSVGVAPHYACDAACRAGHLCAMRHVDVAAYTACLRGHSPVSR